MIEALLNLVEDSTRGGPMSPLRWTYKSTRHLAAELSRQKYQVSSTKVARLLHSEGCSLQANRKTVGGKQHSGRDAQFQYIAQRVKAYKRSRQPVISIDTKKGGTWKHEELGANLSPERPVNSSECV